MMSSRFPLFLLIAQIFSFLTRFDRWPIITLFCMTGMVLIHIDKNILGLYSNELRACISYNYVMYYKQYDRLFWHGVIHLSDWHIYYNMINFLWKGATLEPIIGTAHYLVLILISIPLSGAVYLCLIYGLFVINGESYKKSYLHQCSAGFSGVLFALRVVELSVAHTGSRYSIFGSDLRIPKHLVVWVELLIIHFIEPNSSFLGHLSGILVGFLYCTGPLNLLINTLCQSNIYPNIYWIPFASVFFPRQQERDDVDDEPYRYPRSYRQSGDSSDGFTQQELIRARVLNATERRLFRQRSQR